MENNTSPKTLTVEQYLAAYDMPKCSSADVLSLVMDRTDDRFDDLSDALWEFECTGADEVAVVAWINERIG